MVPESQSFGTISTLPLGYAENWTKRSKTSRSITLCRLTQALEGIEQETGRRIVVCLEMEPGCVLESILDRYSSCFASSCPPQPRRCPSFSGQNSAVYRRVLRYLSPGRDVREPCRVFKQDSQGRESSLARSSYRVRWKSCEPNTPEAVIAALTEFDEPRYLHQVRARGADGNIAAAADLGDALNDKKCSYMMEPGGYIFMCRSMRWRCRPRSCVRPVD